MAKVITEISINAETKDLSINLKEQISGDQYEYSDKIAVLSDVDKAAILAIITPYLTL